MKALIVEDDFGSRRMMQKLVAAYGDCDVVVDGEEAVEAFLLAWEEYRPYDVVFMDIMMPKVDGQEALVRIRAIEKDMGVKPTNEVKIIMTTVLEDPKNVMEAFNKGGATAYMVKPITPDKLRAELEKLGYGSRE
jgi:two-component system chemotaxis response regulator CheY